MNRPMVLLYNLSSEKGGRVCRMCLAFGMAFRLVKREEYGLTLGELAEGKHAETPWTGEDFSEELLVLVNCPGPLLDRFLQGFRRHKIPPVSLKAVLTPTNAAWNASQLRAELVREREAIRQGQEAHRQDQG